MTRFAHDVTVDHAKKQLRIDGIVFPWHIARGVELERVGTSILCVNLGLWTDNYTEITADGKAAGVRTTSPADELEWARLAGRDAAIKLAQKIGLLP